MRRRRAGIERALDEARLSLEEGGVPIGAALVDEKGTVLGVGHNRRVQESNPVLHAEIACLADAGRQADYSEMTLYSTLMPCYMCAGAVVQFGIPRIVVGESRNFSGAADFLQEKGVEVIDLDDAECREMLEEFISSNPGIWLEDIGEANRRSRGR